MHSWQNLCTLRSYESGMSNAGWTADFHNVEGGPRQKEDAVRGLILEIYYNDVPVPAVRVLLGDFICRMGKGYCHKPMLSFEERCKTVLGENPV